MITRSAIPQREIAFHPLSFADPNARLFDWEGQLYRGVYGHRVPFFERLLDDGIIDDLVGRGMLIPTERTDLTAEAFGLILRHKRLPFVSYPFEWSALMLRDATLLMLDLQQHLLRQKLTLQDGHSWNVLWDGPRPMFVDLGSIVDYDGGWWSGFQEFCEFFLYPLRFMAAGQARIARWLMRDMHAGFHAREMELLRGNGTGISAGVRSLAIAKSVARGCVPMPLRRALRSARESTRRSPSLDELFGDIRSEIAKMSFPAGRTQWSDYYAEEYPSFTPSEAWTPKHHGVHDVLQRLMPATVVDVGANRGWHAQLAARQGASVLAFDTDEVCIDQLYSDVRRDKQNVHPIVMSIVDPAGAHGAAGAKSVPAVDRFRSDLVLALAVTHHLVFTRLLTFEHIAESLASLTNRALLVEFVPPDDAYVRNWLTPRHEWYTLENFVRALGRHFRVIDVKPSHPAPRVLILAQR